MTKFLTNICLLSLPWVLFVGVAAAQTLTGPTGNIGHAATVADRQLQSARQQIGSRDDNAASARDRAVQSEIDHLYDEIMRAAARRAR